MTTLQKIVERVKRDKVFNMRYEDGWLQLKIEDDDTEIDISYKNCHIAKIVEGSVLFPIKRLIEREGTQALQDLLNSDIEI